MSGEEDVVEDDTMTEVEDEGIVEDEDDEGVVEDEYEGEESVPSSVNNILIYFLIFGVWKFFSAF